MPQVGEVLYQTYRLDRVLGWGAAGIVYAAWDLLQNRPCAIKLLHPNFVEHPDIRERFRREAQSASKLLHPHIIRVLAFHDEKWPLMAVELLHGESLRQRLGRGALPLPTVDKLYRQLCAAMDAAHKSGIVHRDLKPENIFLSHPQGGADPEEFSVKVLDFGISKITDHTEITAMHALLGSPSYMSPEQARGDARMVDGRADIFSMGVLLFECLTARKAFAVDDAESKRQLILAGAVPSLRDFAPSLPLMLDAVIQRACAVEPLERYQTAADFYQAFETAVLSPAPVSPPAGKPRALPLPGVKTMGPSASETTEAVTPLSLHDVQVIEKTEITAPKPSQKPAEAEGSGEGPLPWAFLERLPLGQRYLTSLRTFARGREGLLLMPMIFLSALLVVWLVILVDRMLSAEDPRYGPAPKRLEVIDGQRSKQ